MKGATREVDGRKTTDARSGGTALLHGRSRGRGPARGRAGHGGGQGRGRGGAMRASRGLGSRGGMADLPGERTSLSEVTPVVNSVFE